MTETNILDSLSLETPLETTTPVDTTDNAIFEQQNAYISEVLKDYEICVLSREASLIARREVLTGKAKFGIIGDGKEVPQVAMARAFRKGDWRSGYYRDQTFMMAAGLCSVEDFFAQLYADHDNDPFSGGRQMNSHFATPTIDKKTGEWLATKNLKNSSSDISCTGGQMARGLGLALASKKYRELSELRNSTPFSDNGNEVSFVTIGDASTSEGVFWETVNAAVVMRVPMAVAVWDDGYGISVPISLQTAKSSISEALAGFQLNEDGEGMDIYTCKGWDYPSLCEMFEKGTEKTRKTHIPCLFHVQELTQPQGHSTSGSHERYKSKERLEWERQNDCNLVMRNWLLNSGMATEEQLVEIEATAKQKAREGKQKAWANYFEPVKKTWAELTEIVTPMAAISEEIAHLVTELGNLKDPAFSELVKIARQIANFSSNDTLNAFIQKGRALGASRYNTHLYSSSDRSALNIPIVPAVYSEDSPTKSGYEILNTLFDEVLGSHAEVFAFGEDVGQIGDVNQGFMGMQQKYGVERVFDTGIREWTIMGQALGMAMRGLRPIAEIQYLDYLMYGISLLSDDLATLRYRSNGTQQAPMIVRTRGHRLEGIWHAGSPMGLLVNALKGMYICVPRNMTQAAGFYNTLLRSDDPALVVECLNGYRLKERLPDNLKDYTLPLGVPEVLQSGTDLTLVTYGSSVRLAEEAITVLAKQGISVELIDIQTLLPFDLEGVIVQSLKKTNRVLFLDEDLPNGGTAYMLNEVLVKQNGYRFLDAKPLTLSAQPHRPPFGSDGDYFSKPNAEDIIDAVKGLIAE